MFLPINKIKNYTIISLICYLSILGSTSVYAAQCPGVEARIVATNDQSASNIISHYLEGFSAFNAMINQQMQQLLSAQKVVTQQDSTSAYQENTISIQSAKAAANSYVNGRVASQIREANDEFSSTGYNACSMEAATKTFYNSFNNAFQGDPVQPLSSQISNKPGSIAGPARWISQIRSGENTSAGALFGGDLDKAAKYINVVMGPPDNYTRKNNSLAESKMYDANKLAKDTQKGISLYVLSSIAQESGNGGPQAALENILNQYVGDGGERWSSSMAGSHTRGILLDAVRIQAANVAAEAYALRKSMRTEFVIASYALTRTNKIVHPSIPTGH